MMIEALKLAGSLAGIFVIFFIALRLGLGGDVRLRDEAQARELAEHAICGFEADAVALDRAGVGALLRDASGRILLLRRHGAHFAARVLDSHTGARLDRNFLTIATGDKRFGSFTLDLGEQAAVWASSLRRLESAGA